MSMPATLLPIYGLTPLARGPLARASRIQEPDGIAMGQKGQIQEVEAGSNLIHACR